MEQDGYGRVPAEDGDSDLARPEDSQKRLRYAVFLLHGIAMLWPWNSLITASDYYHAKFANSPSLSKFSSWLASSFNVTVLVILACAAYLNVSRYLHLRIVLSNLASAALFGVIVAVVAWNISPLASYYVLLICSTLLAGLTAIFQNACFAVVTRHPDQCMQAILVGQGVAGVLPALVNLVIEALRTSRETAPKSDGGAIAYFSTAIFISSIAAFGDILIIGTEKGSRKAAIPQARLDRTLETVSNGYLLRELKYLCASMFSVFFVSLFLFPAVTSSVRSVDSNNGSSRTWLSRSNVFVSLGFLIWNGFDLIGRSISHFNFGTRLDSARSLFLWSLSRFGFIAALALCNIEGRGARIDSDYFYWFIMALFGLSNGYIAGRSWLAIPSHIQNITRRKYGLLANPDDQDAEHESIIEESRAFQNDAQERANTIMLFIMMGGIALGSTFSFIIVKILHV